MIWPGSQSLTSLFAPSNYLLDPQSQRTLLSGKHTPVLYLCSMQAGKRLLWLMISSSRSIVALARAEGL